MNRQHLFKKFSDALLWNGALYGVYKVLSLVLMVSLYAQLPVELFSAWATINSIVFIVLLWLDGGFHKSIPRFSPLFVQHPFFYRRFIGGLLLIQILIIGSIGLPLLSYILPYFLNAVLIAQFKNFASLLFITEGMIIIMRLIYHANFWQKHFNILSTLCFLGYVISCLYAQMVGYDAVQLIYCLITYKLYANALIIIVSLSMFGFLYTRTVTEELGIPGALNAHAITKEFIVHSGMMWASTFIKSLSERNVLFPYLTLASGSLYANSFKVAHELALSLQRIALKTIGVSDTLLLTYSTTSLNTKDFQQSFVLLKHKIAQLCGGLIIVGFAIGMANSSIVYSMNLPFLLFVGSCYMIETFLSPYERVLETNRSYKLLWIAYIPYLLGVILFFWWLPGTLVGVIILHIVRLVSALSMVWLSRRFIL